MTTASAIRQVNSYSKEWFWKSLPGHLHFIFGLARGIVPDVHKRYGYGFGLAVCIVRDSTITWFWRTEALAAMRKRFIRAVTSDPRFLPSFKARWEKTSQRFNKTVDRVNRTDLSRVSDARLLQLYQRLYEDYNRSMGVGQQSDALLSAGGEDWFYTLLRKEMPRLTDSERALLFEVLSAPVYTSFSLSERLDRLAIAARIKKKQRLARRFTAQSAASVWDALQRYPEIAHALSSHTRRFYWTENNYDRVFVFDERYYIKKIARLIKKQTNLDELYRREKAVPGMNRKKKRLLIKKHAVPKKVQNVVKLIEEFMIMHDEKKGNIMKNNHCLHLFLNEISRRTGIPSTELYYTVADDIPEIIRTHTFDRALLRERSKGCAFVISSRGCMVLSGSAFRRINIKKLYGVQKASSEVRGVGASPGTAEGKVRVIKNNSEFIQMKRGEVLVTNNTTPEFVPLMKKAAAIVTEQGGMTTHAAIVSRELGVPCVIGTKNATMALKTGDRVRVDASHGVVTKL